MLNSTAPFADTFYWLGALLPLDCILLSGGGCIERLLHVLGPLQRFDLIRKDIVLWQSAFSFLCRLFR